MQAISVLVLALTAPLLAQTPAAPVQRTLSETQVKIILSLERDAAATAAEAAEASVRLQAVMQSVYETCGGKALYTEHDSKAGFPACLPPAPSAAVIAPTTAPPVDPAKPRP